MTKQDKSETKTSHQVLSDLSSARHQMNEAILSKAKSSVITTLTDSFLTLQAQVNQMDSSGTLYQMSTGTLSVSVSDETGISEQVN
jgi:hypothetical protein